MCTIKAFAKVNLYLKITGFSKGYHSINSRFLRVDDLYDTISFIPCKCESFTIEGIDNVELKSNTIYKAFVALNDFCGNLDILDFFHHHKVVVDKRIPTLAGLGGGSSDAASFLVLTNKVCNLNIDTPTLAKIGSLVGADVAFFIYNYRAANVSGFGEIIESFEEDDIKVELFTPSFGCDTADVYKAFKNNFLDKIEPKKFEHWKKLKFRDILKETSSDRSLLNDLYRAAKLIYPNLENQKDKEWFFSGSGSTFFKIKNFTES
ncbi:MAG: 4-diphosphocytidyl-2C-methyl-D-erythritol kinase [Sulfurovum sp. AS07-7]|nr:MAG: 4-diphosphocytidyl-2C-methyl-D-erythritol kinase [Sulfurovum sp. AS07-7]